MHNKKRNFDLKRRSFMKQSEKPRGLQSYKRPRRGRPRPLHRAVASPGSEKTKRTGMCEGHLISYLYFTILWWPCIYFFSYFSRAGGEDDFELFLANVKARSLKTTARLREGICNILVYRKPYQKWLHFVRIASLILVAFLLQLQILDLHVLSSCWKNGK